MAHYYIERMVAESTYENLVFEGGGVRGFAYVGVLKFMNDENKLSSIKRVIGTSVGSIFATLVACKCTNDDLDQCSSKLFNEMSKINDSYVQEGYNLINGIGIHDNVCICDMMDSFISNKFGLKNVTFQTLFEKTGIDLTIFGTCLTTRSAEFFNHKSYPNMEVSKAIQISTAIPVFFKVVNWDEKSWVDGGVVENFAIEHYDNESGQYNQGTLGLYLLQDNENKQSYKINNIVDLLDGIENIELDNNIKQSISRVDKRSIIYIGTGTISPINFAITETDKQFLIDNGYKSTKDFFEKNKKRNDEKTFMRSVLNYIYPF